jgi:hypothetical protein
VSKRKLRSGVPWAFAHGLVTPSAVEFKARTADVKPAILWINGNISAVSALFMLAKLTFMPFILAAVAHTNRLTIAAPGFYPFNARPHICLDEEIPENENSNPGAQDLLTCAEHRQNDNSALASLAVSHCRRSALPARRIVHRPRSAKHFRLQRYQSVPGARLLKDFWKKFLEKIFACEVLGRSEDAENSTFKCRPVVRFGDNFSAPLASCALLAHTLRPGETQTKTAASEENRRFFHN